MTAEASRRVRQLRPHALTTETLVRVIDTLTDIVEARTLDRARYEAADLLDLLQGTNPDSAQSMVRALSCRQHELPLEECFGDVDKRSSHP